VASFEWFNMLVWGISLHIARASNPNPEEASSKDLQKKIDKRALGIK